MQWNKADIVMFLYQGLQSERQVQESDRQYTVFKSSNYSNQIKTGDHFLYILNEYNKVCPVWHTLRDLHYLMSVANVNCCIYYT